MNSLINILTNIMTKFGLLKEDLDYHLVRASMVIIFLFFGYQKWFEYEAQVLIPYISNGSAKSTANKVAVRALNKRNRERTLT
jgi:uncharacterized membrane protein YkgB